jgi:hypothetical protein
MLTEQQWISPDSMVLGLGSVAIVLDSTSLRDVQTKLGGTVWSRGQTSQSVRSLCYQIEGSRPLVAVIESSVVGGSSAIVTSIKVQSTAGIPPECELLPRSNSTPHLPYGVRLGLEREVVQRQLDLRCRSSADGLICEHEIAPARNAKFYTDCGIELRFDSSEHLVSVLMWRNSTS